MASQSTSSQDTGRRASGDGSDHRVSRTIRSVTDTVAGAAGAAGAAAGSAASAAASAANEVATRAPEVAQVTRDALDEANRLVKGGSDPTLRLVGVASLAFAAGLLVGGSNRLLIIASLVPAAMVGTALVERTERRPSGATGRTTARVQGD